MVADVKRPAIYIAGPMSGYENFNFPAFDAAEKFLTSMGFTEVFNPAQKDRETYGREIEDNPDGCQVVAKDLGFDLRKTLEIDLSYICSTATHIYMLDGWEKSTGARAEHATAVALGLEIVYQRGY